MVSSCWPGCARARPSRPRGGDDFRRCTADAARSGAGKRVQVRAQTGRRARAAGHGSRGALGADPPLEVISARPEWVELVVPCTRDAVDRIEAVMAHLEADLAPDVRESIGYAFRELLLNAIEWGGRLDATRQVRIACLHSPRMLMYRIADPGSGFKIDDLPHAAIGQPTGSAHRAHAHPRGKGHPAGRLWTADRARERGRTAVQREAQRGRVCEVSGGWCGPTRHSCRPPEAPRRRAGADTHRGVVTGKGALESIGRAYFGSGHPSSSARPHSPRWP